MRKDSSTIEKQVLNWNPQGQSKRGRPKKSWRRVVQEKAGTVGKTWREVIATDGNTLPWCCFVEDFVPKWRKRN
jgi:hypothetical protein